MSEQSTKDSFRMVRMRLYPWQSLALNSKIRHLAMYGGVGIGKSYTGAHFAIDSMMTYPETTGLIGANTYDQLTAATLKELFYWLDYYGIEWVVDRLPPEEWGAPRRFKNIRISSPKLPLKLNVLSPAPAADFTIVKVPVVGPGHSTNSTLTSSNKVP